jgi:drug/metabolite transporter (DMT)-like permease
MTGSYATGLALLVVLALARSEPFPAVIDLIWATLAGLAGVAGLSVQYRALAVGKMGIAAPVAAVTGAAVPVAFSAMVEGVPGAIQLVGFGLALISVWLIARSQNHSTGGRNGLGLAVIAGTGFGLFFILIDRVSENAVFWPLVAARGVSFLALFAVAQISRSAWRPARASIPIILLAGLLDVGGNTFFLLAAQSGRLDAASVLSSLYPAVTVVLARAILNEEIARVQGIGILAALTAIPLIAA